MSLGLISWSSESKRIAPLIFFRPIEQILKLKELAKQDVINKKIRIILVKASNYMTTKTEGRLFYWDVLSDPRKVRRTAGDYITGKIKKVEEDRILLYNCDFSDIKISSFSYPPNDDPIDNYSITAKVKILS